MASQAVGYHLHDNRHRSNHDNGHRKSTSYDCILPSSLPSVNTSQEPHVFLDLRNYLARSPPSRNVNDSDHRDTHGRPFHDNSSLKDNHEEPYVFLDLRGYFAGHQQDNKKRRTHAGHIDHKDRTHSRDSDYIHPASAPRCKFAQSEHIYQAPRSGGHHDLQPKHDEITYPVERPREGDYTSPWDKTDRQMIREGGWTSMEHFMESHGLSIYEPGDFDEVKDLLDRYRQEDALAAGEYHPAPRSHPHRSTRFSADQEEDSILDYNEGRENADRYRHDRYLTGQQDRGYREPRRPDSAYYDNDTTRFSDDHRHPHVSGNGSEYSSPDYKDFGRAYNVYNESPIDKHDIDRAHSPRADDHHDSSDYDSTDAIDYYSDLDASDDDVDGDDFVDDDKYDYY